MAKKYESPSIERLGSLREMTLNNNKIGPNPDGFSADINIVGSIVPVQQL
jgi:hypothetical protein